MEKMIAKPQLGFSEAVKLAMSRLTEIKGRSRRSEFWWTMLAYLIFYWIVSTIAALVLPYNVAQIAASLLSLLVLPLTIRRVQDTGHNMLWPVLSWLSGLVMTIFLTTSGLEDVVTSVNPDPEAIVDIFANPIVVVCSLITTVAGIGTFIFCLLDSEPKPNKYGESPKYVVERDFSDSNSERREFQNRDFEEIKL